MEKTERKHFVYGHVFESLTAGLYPNRREILREYIQNAYDAIVAARDVGILDAQLIRVQTDGNNLYIHDEGIGMDAEVMEEYRYFGYSRKRIERDVGFRGIGKLAGLAVADTMVVVSKRKDSPYVYRYKCEARKMLEAVRKAKERGENIPLEDLIEEYSSINQSLGASDQHFTTVELYGIRDDEGHLTNAEQVMSYLANVAPVPFNHERFQHALAIQEKLKSYLPRYEPVQLLVNGKPVYKPYTDDAPLEDLHFIEVPGQVGPRAICWYLAHKHARQISPENPRGLAYRCKGFAVGDETLVRNTIFSAGRAGMVYWYAGEIHILDPGMIPSASRTEFEDAPGRQEFYAVAKEAIAKPLNNYANQRSNVSAFEKESAKAAATVKAVEKKLKNNTLAPEVKIGTIEQLESSKEKLITKVNSVRDPKKRDEALLTVQKIEAVTKALKKGDGVVNVKEQLGLADNEYNVYSIIMSQVTKWFNENDPIALEGFVASVHRALKRRT